MTNTTETTTRRHRCTADCWAYMVRNGQDENTTDCDPWKARAAATWALLG